MEDDERKSEALLKRYAHGLNENFRLHWPAVRLHGELDVGSIEEFMVIWENETDENYKEKKECIFKVKVATTNVADLYLYITGLISCENSHIWPDRTKRHTTYLRGTYWYDEENGPPLKFLVMIQQRVCLGEVMCRIRVTCRSPLISQVMADAYFLWCNN